MAEYKQQVRRTGKTFRAILKALELASEGKWVVLLSKTDSSAKRAMYTAQNIVEVAISQADYKFSPRCIELGRGKVYFDTHKKCEFSKYYKEGSISFINDDIW